MTGHYRSRFIRNIAITLMLAACTADARQMAPTPGSEIPGQVDAESFTLWKNNFEVKAIQSGISKPTVHAALDELKPNKKVVGYDQAQPEFKKLTKEEYLANVINQARIDKGRKVMADNHDLLAEISAHTGVEPEFIVALYGLESSYGEREGNFSVVNSLATLAYEGRRREFFESELIAALQIADSGRAGLADLKGSWAGAMGGCQFMPSSYLAYAVDYDGDGRVDIWNDKADTFASIANYLASIGWGADDALKTKTLMHWNKSTYFVASVFELAKDIKQ